MTETARLPKAQLTGIQGRLLSLAVKRKLGRVPGSVEMMWNHPAVFKDMMRVGSRVETWDRLAPQLASYAVMAAAAVIGCSFCLDFNYFLAHDKGLDAAKAREVPRWRTSEVFSPLERQVMEYAEGVCATPLAVPDALTRALLDELGADGLLELTARIGFMNLSARTNVALGIRSEHFADACGLAPLAERPVEVPGP